MGLQNATGLNRPVKSAEAKTRHAGRLNIGPRLILGFVIIILSMLAADAVVLWQFQVVSTQAGRLNDIDQMLVAVLRVHISLLAFRDRLNALADSEDADRLVTEAGPLRTAALEDIRRATSALSLRPFDLQRDPTILPTLQVIQSALPSQLEAITTLATSGDWRAVHLRLANQIRPLESLTSALVEKVEREVSEEHAQTVSNITRVQRRVFLIVPMTAVFTLLIAGTLGLAMTRSITQPLERLVDGAKALARGEFQHQVAISGDDELAHLGQVFNVTAGRLRDLYATLQSSEDRLRRVIDTIPAHVWSALPDGSVDFINQRWLESTGLPVEDGLGWDWGSTVHPEDLARFVDEWHTALAAGEPMESEARLRRGDGEYRWWLIRNVPLRDELGMIVNWYGTAIDIEERHRAEDALRRSEAYLAEAQRLSRTGSLSWRVSTGEILWSEETFRIFQYDKATKLTVELVLERTHPKDVAFVKETIERASQDGKDLDFEYRLLMPDGSVKHVHVVGHAEGDKSSGLEYVGAVMDITAAKEAADRIQLIINTVPGSIWTARPDGSTDFISQRWLDYTGLTSEEMLGWSWRAVIHPDDLERALDVWRASVTEGKPLEAESRYRRFDGEYRWFLNRAFPLLDRSGHVVGWYGNDVDIHDRKQAEEALRRSEADLNEAQRVSHTGSWRHDLVSGVVTISPEGRRMWGISPDEDSPATEFFIGRMHPEDAPVVAQEYAAARLKKGEFLSDFRIVLPDGTVKNIHSVGHPILNQSGDVVEFVGAALDVTERKRAEEALRQAQADLAHVSRVTTMGELTASLAHEVKQPIAAAVTDANTCVRWLARDPANIEEARAASLRTAEDARRAMDIISRIRLLFTKGAPQREWVDVNELIREMIVLLRSEATRYAISVRMALDANLPHVMGDRVQLQQVLMNLIMNSIDALKAVEGTRDLAITSQRGENEQLLVSVSDTGVGLPPQQADQIFKAFFTTKEHGIGMGLSISRSIVESHGGHLWAADHAPRGASFCLTLPTTVEGHE